MTATVLGEEHAALPETWPRPERRIDIPSDGLGYRLKCLVLAPPLGNDALEHERLGRALQCVRVQGRVRALRVRPIGDVPALECRRVDGTGAMRAVFLGRRSIAEIGIGTGLRIEGRAGEDPGGLTVLNPDYEPLS